MAYSVFQLPIAGSNVKQTQGTQRKPNDFYLRVLSVLCVEFNPRYEDLEPALVAPACPALAGITVVVSCPYEQ